MKLASCGLEATNAVASINLKNMGSAMNESNTSTFDKLTQTYVWFSKQLGWISGALAFLMMIAIIREVIGRYFFKAPTDWAVDLNGFLLVGMVYLGSAYTTVIDGHVRADFFYARITGRSKAYLDIFIELISIYYCSMLTWESWLMAYDSLIYNELSSGGVRWPLFPFQIIVPIGVTLVIICLLLRIIANVRYLMGKAKPFKVLKGGH